MALQTIRIDRYHQHNLGDDVAFVRTVTRPLTLPKAIVAFIAPFDAASLSGLSVLICDGPGMRSMLFASTEHRVEKAASVQLEKPGSSTTIATIYKVIGEKPVVFVVPEPALDMTGTPYWINAVFMELAPTSIVAVCSLSSSTFFGVAGVARGLSLGQGIPELQAPELLGGVVAAAASLTTVPLVALLSSAPIQELTAPAACARAFGALRTTLLAADNGSWLVTPEVFIRRAPECLRRHEAPVLYAAQSMYA